MRPTTKKHQRKAGAFSCIELLAFVQRRACPHKTCSCPRDEQAAKEKFGNVVVGVVAHGEEQMLLRIGWSTLTMRYAAEAGGYGRLAYQTVSGMKHSASRPKSR